jgi:hypothetical protein
MSAKENRCNFHPRKDGDYSGFVFSEERCQTAFLQFGYHFRGKYTGCPEGRSSLALGCVPSMAPILLVKVQPRVFTAKCSEPQVGISNGMDGGSGVTKFLSLRTET